MAKDDKPQPPPQQPAPKVPTTFPAEWVGTITKDDKPGTEHRIR